MTDQTLFLSASPADDAVAAILSGWVGAGVIRPALWTSLATPEPGLPSGALRPEYADARTLGPDPDTARLVTAIGDSVDVLRIVFVQQFASGSGGSDPSGRSGGADGPDGVGEGEPDAGVRAAEAFVAALGELTPTTTRLVRLNLLIGTTDADAVPVTVLAPGWDANVVVAAEARVAPDTTAGIVDDTNADSHAALACATVGALWNGMTHGPCDRLEHVTANNVVPVAVIRSFVRALDGGFLADSIAERVLAVRDKWPLPDSRERRIQQAGDPAGMLAGLATALTTVDNTALRFRRLPSPPRTAREGVGFFGAYVLLFRYIAQRLLRLPGALRDEAVHFAFEKAARTAERMTVGEQSRYVVTVGGVAAEHRPKNRSGDKTAANAGDAAADTPDKPYVPRFRANSAADARDYAGAILANVADDPDTPTRAQLPTTSPRTWAVLRDVSFGLVDAGAMPAEIGDGPVMLGTIREAIEDPGAIAPRPDAAPFRLSADIVAAVPQLAPLAAPLGPYDALAARRIEQILTAEAARLTALEQSLAHADAATKDLKPGAPLPPPIAELYASLAERDRDRADIEARRLLIASEVATFGAWRNPRSPSLLWQVADSVVDELDAVADDYAEAAETLLGDRPVRDERQANRRSLRRFLAEAAGLIVCAGVVVWLLYGPFAAFAYRTVTLVFLAIFLLSRMFMAYLAHCRRMFRYSVALTDQITEYAHAGDRVQRATSELFRLASMYEQLLDWCEVIGWTLHRPWGPPVAPTDIPHGLDVATLPAAFDVATGNTSHDKITELGAIAAQTVIVPGWLSRLSDEQRRDALRRYAQIRGRQATAAFDTPDADTSVGTVPTEESPRKFLRAEIAGGRLSAAARRRAGDDIAARFAAAAPERLFDGIVRLAELGPLAAGRPLVAGRIVPGSLVGASGSIDTVVVTGLAKPSVVMLVIPGESVASGSGVIVAGGVIATNAHLVADASIVHIQDATGAVHAAQVLGRHPDDDIAVVQCDTLASAPIPMLGDSDRLAHGEPVVAIGHPLGMEGGASVSVGIVAATGRTIQTELGELHGMIQTDATIAGGSSGGALVNAHGEIVGVTTSVAATAEAIGFALPINRVIALVADIVGAADAAGAGAAGGAGDPDAGAQPVSVGEVRGSGPAVSALVPEVSVDATAWLTEIATESSGVTPRIFDRSRLLSRSPLRWTTKVWAPESVHYDASGTPTESFVAESTLHIGRPYLVEVVRADISEPVEPEVLRLFATAPTDDAGSPGVPDGNDVPPDAPIVGV